MISSPRPTPLITSRFYGGTGTPVPTHGAVQAFTSTCSSRRRPRALFTCRSPRRWGFFRRGLVLPRCSELTMRLSAGARRAWSRSPSWMKMPPRSRHTGERRQSCGVACRTAAESSACHLCPVVIRPLTQLRRRDIPRCLLLRPWVVRVPGRGQVPLMVMALTILRAILQPLEVMALTIRLAILQPLPPRPLRRRIFAYSVVRISARGKSLSSAVENSPTVCMRNAS